MASGFRSSGFVRRLDELGRVVLPVEWRRTVGLDPGTPVEMILSGDGSLTLQRYVPGGTCTFCGTPDDLRQFSGRPVCRTCGQSLGALVQA